MGYPMRRARRWCMYLLDLFYPNCCPCCHKKILWKEYLCESCCTEMRMPGETFCPGCGKPWSQCICSTDLYYDRACVVTLYEGAGRKGILSMKSAESLQFGWHCAAILSERVLQDPQLRGYDLIVPVPMAKSRKKKRICNPAEVLAKELALLTGIPMRTDLLVDHGTGMTQHLLSAEARRRNVGQFDVQSVDLNGYRIILCDDVLTTGSTLNRCAQLLKSCGAVSVAAFVAASTSLHH